MCDGPLTDAEMKLIEAECAVIEWKQLFLDLLNIHNELLDNLAGHEAEARDDGNKYHRKREKRSLYLRSRS